MLIPLIIINFFFSLFAAFEHTILPHYLPESCVLIVIGFIIGLIISFLPREYHGELSGGLNGELFFIFLLPPIMLDAGYNMPIKPFFNNIGTILLYAVVGTLFNTFTIGFSLYGISVWQLDGKVRMKSLLILLLKIRNTQTSRS